MPAPTNEEVANRTTLNLEAKMATAPPTQQTNFAPPTSASSSFNFSKKILIVPAMIVLILAISAGGYFYFNKIKTYGVAEDSSLNATLKSERDITEIASKLKQLEAEKKALASQVVITSPSPKINQIAQNIYSSPTHGVSFEAPTDWEKVSENETSAVFRSAEQTKNSSQILFQSNVNLIIDLAPNAQDLETYKKNAEDLRVSGVPGYNLLNSTKEQLGGQVAYIDDYLATVDSISIRQRQVYAIKDGKAFIFTFSSLPEVWEAYASIFDTIGNSFKFSGIVSGIRIGF